jgi:protein-disulfide isomerase
MASRKEQRQRAREERVRRETEAARQDRRKRLSQLGAGAVFLAVVIVGALIVISQSGGGSGGDTKLEDVAAIQDQLHGLEQHGTTLGDPSAKATVVEYGDLQCPICREYSLKVIPQLIAGPVRSGKAKLEFRNWTIIGPQSQDAAKAALAAGAQGRYWSFVELFYRNQGTENSGYVTDSFLEAIAKGAGVPDIAKWNQDRQSAQWEAVLSRDNAQAKALGFTGTPSFVVEGPKGKKALGTPGSAQEIESAISAVS